MLGLGRHLELQERKKKLEQEKKQREDELFGLAAKYDDRVNDARSNHTVPQPFHLSAVRIVADPVE